MLLLALACASAPRTLVAPDASRAGDPGALGPHGAAALARTYTARLTDTVATTVVYPSGDGGALAVTDAPVVVLVHGGFVAPERYEWLAAHLATRGAVVLLPLHDLELALFEAGNASAALDGLLVDAAGDGPLAGASSPGAPAIVGGHSLGAVTASVVWIDEDRFDGLFLAAGYPVAGADVAARADAPVLALVGAADERSPPAEVAENLAPFGIPLGVVDGLNHYGWTDDATASELARDGQEMRPVDEARADALAVLDIWTAAVFAGDDAAADAVAGSSYDGVTWEAP